MKKMIIILAVTAMALTALTASPVKNYSAAACIKRYFERVDNGRYKGVKIGCKNGMPTANRYDSRYKKRGGVWAFSGSLGAKVKRVCANPCR